jgi:HPt (histidine-containing phosphotransfer) domain-containing protein
VPSYTAASSLDGAETYPEIAGVNSREGLQNIGGSLSDYISILSVFCKDAGERIGEIREAAETGDFTRYTILVHAMKSASRSIGAAGLGAEAERLEDAGNNRDVLAITNKTAGFLERLQTLTENITTVIARHNEAEETEDADLFTLKLHTLKEALAAFNIEAVNLFMKNCMNMPMSAKTRESMREIEQYILLFEYEKAIERIDAIYS